MKNKLGTFYKFIFGFATILTLLWSCTDIPGKVGYDLLPAGDLVQVFKDSTYTVSGLKAFTETDGYQRTDEPTFNLLGTFNDPIFGKTKADFALQFRIDSFPKKQNVVAIDSLVLYMVYNEIYGDTKTQQNFKVYELASDLSKASKYYQDVDLKSMAKSQVLADFNYIPKFKLDSLTTRTLSKKEPKDTVIQTMRIRLDQSLATKLMAADSTTLSSNDPVKGKNYFLNYFKGLYIETSDLNSGGAIMRIKATANGSKMVMYYHTAKDTLLKISYKINDHSARVSKFAHDYSQTTFVSEINKTDVQDSLLYLQTSGGLRTKIFIPNLGTWKDSTNFAINKAEIIFQVDSILSDEAKLMPPDQLVFSAIGVDSIGNPIKYLPKDFEFSAYYYNGTYNSKDKTYRFNIANHMQQVIDKISGKENMGFYLATSQPVSTFKRVVLKGPGSKTGIRLQITYSKIK